MASVFTKIINGEIPCYKVAENENCIAFLDINPNTKGHTLCVPKKEENKLFDLPEQQYKDLMDFVFKVAKAIEKVIECDRVGLAVVGLEVPHAHIHLIPIKEPQDMTFLNKTNVDESQFPIIAEKIRQEFERNK